MADILPMLGGREATGDTGGRPTLFPLRRGALLNDRPKLLSPASILPEERRRFLAPNGTTSYEGERGRKERERENE